MHRAVTFFITIGLCIVLSAPVLAAKSVRVCRDAASAVVDNGNVVNRPQAGIKKAKADYGGTVRVFVVEPTSRWSDSEAKPYDFGFLSFAVVQPIVIPYGEKVDIQAIWNGNDFKYNADSATFGDVTEDNIMVIAAIYNDDPVTAYSDPPSGYPFPAHYVDAAAAARPGETGYNQITPTSTHTVFIEEGSATY
ncbi:MAG: hypothetical protein PHR28_00930 [candidate division Zixibacteria bacterium]|nr:hypothetical protein [candidate division Zixibacteria bacterium]